MKLKLYTARFIQGVTQADLQRECGVYQPALSLLEKSRIDNITIDQKKKIEHYLKMPIDWDTTEEPDPLDREELKDFRFFVTWIRKSNGETKTLKWVQSFDTTREAFVAAKKVIDNSRRVMIPVREMEWRNE